MRSEREKMLAGEMYSPVAAELAAGRLRARQLCRAFGALPPDDLAGRARVLGELFGRVGPRVEIEPPFYCDYGRNIFAGDNLFMNFSCVLLDCARIEIGRNAFFGPYVQLYAAYHPVDPAERLRGEFARPITIGDDVWIGGGAIVLAGVRIGDGATIGAGSVVTHDVPERAVAAGNPCRVLRRL